MRVGLHHGLHYGLLNDLHNEGHHGLLNDLHNDLQTKLDNLSGRPTETALIFPLRSAQRFTSRRRSPKNGTPHARFGQRRDALLVKPSLREPIFLSASLRKKLCSIRQCFSVDLSALKPNQQMAKCEEGTQYIAPSATIGKSLCPGTRA